MKSETDSAELLTDSQLYARLVRLLATREYSQAELRRKMQQWQVQPDQMARAIDMLHAQGLQSDSRFLEMLVRSKAARGYGPNVIRQLAMQHQLPRAEVQQQLQAAEFDWYELARVCYCKRFGNAAPASMKEKQQRMAYLLRHGFDSDQIREAIVQQS